MSFRALPLRRKGKSDEAWQAQWRSFERSIKTETRFALLQFIAPLLMLRLIYGEAPIDKVTLFLARSARLPSVAHQLLAKVRFYGRYWG
jgi:hypothetical protein